MKLIKNILNFFLSLFLFRPFLKSKIFVFCYHDISDSEAIQHSEYYSTPKALFREHIDFIQKHFEIIPIDKIKERHLLDKNKRYAIITFDDGFNSVLSEAHPFLSERNIPYAMFVNKTAIEKNQLWFSNLTLHKKDKEYLGRFFDSCVMHKTTEDRSDFINGNLSGIIENVQYESLRTDGETTTEKVYADIEDLRTLLQTTSLITIGNHTSNHVNLGKCSAALQQETIVSNHQYISSMLNINMEHFAIPFGKRHHFSQETLRILSENNYKYIYSTNPTYIDLNSDAADAVFPRIGITNQTIPDLIFYINRTLLKKIDL